MRYLIQGVFFQSLVGLDLQTLETGKAVVLTQLVGSMFCGVLESNRKNFASEGFTFDVYGKAGLDEIRIADNTLSFVKQYSHRPDTIEYSYAKLNDGTWVGGWAMKLQGEELARGETRCIIPPVTERFFEPTVKVVFEA